MAATIERTLLEAFARKQVMATELIENIKNLDLAELAQIYIIHRGDNAGMWPRPPAGWKKESLALAKRLHELKAENPLAHVVNYGRNFETEDYEQLSPELARSLAKHVGEDFEDAYSLPSFLTQEEILKLVKKNIKTSPRGFGRVVALNTYIERFGLTDEIYSIAEDACYYLTEENLKKVLEITQEKELLEIHLGQEDLNGAILANPNFTTKIFFKALKSTKTLKLESQLEAFAKHEKLEEISKELLQAKPKTLKGAASPELLQASKDAKKRIAKGKYSIFGPPLETYEDKIYSHEKDFENLKKILDRAQANAKKGKVTQAYVTQLETTLENAKAYQKGLGIETSITKMKKTS